MGSVKDTCYVWAKKEQKWRLDSDVLFDNFVNEPSFKNLYVDDPGRGRGQMLLQSGLIANVKLHFFSSYI